MRPSRLAQAVTSVRPRALRGHRLVQILRYGSGALRAAQTLDLIFFFFILFFTSNQNKTCLMEYPTFQRTGDHGCTDGASGGGVGLRLVLGRVRTLLLSVCIGISCKCGIG